MATAPNNSGPSSAGITLASDPFCTRGLREALERLERQIGCIGEIASDSDAVAGHESLQADHRLADQEGSAATTDPPAAAACDNEPNVRSLSRSADAEREALAARIQQEFTKELTSANSRCAAAEQRAQSLEAEVSAANLRADELARQVAALEAQLEAHLAAQREAQLERQTATPMPKSPPPAAPEPDLQKQMATLQSELRLIRKERDQLMTRLQREESRLQKAGITIEWDKPASRPKAAKAKRRSSG